MCKWFYVWYFIDQDKIILSFFAGNVESLVAFQLWGPSSLVRAIPIYPNHWKSYLKKDTASNSTPAKGIGQPTPFGN